MKKTRTAAALAVALLAGTAAAQSSVTLFGVADVAVRHARTHGVGHVTSLVSGAYSSARWGVRGQEDLGGGLVASFWLESFLSMDTGAISPAGFQRRSTLSLSHRDWGELRAGRDYTPTHSSWARFDPFGYVGIGAVQLFALSAAGTTPVTAAFGTSPNTIQRTSNTVEYLLPRNAWGLEGGLSYALREDGTAASDQHHAAGGRLGITLGPVFVSAASFRTRNNLTTDAFQDTALAATYNAGFARVSAGIRRYDFRDARQNNYLLGVVVPSGASEFKFSWNRAAMDGTVGTTSIDANRADQFALGYVYHFSKRTRVYATLAQIENKGNARFVVPGAPAGTGGAKSRGFETGVNHEF